MGAGVEKLAVYGELQTIDALAEGDVLKYNAILRVSIGTIINKLSYDKDKAQYQKRLYEIKSKNKE